MFSLTELFRDDGTANWQDNHVRNGVDIDFPNSCWFPFTNKDYVGSTIWFPFYVQAQTRGSLDWEGKFQTVLRKVMYNLGAANLPEMGSYQRRDCGKPQASGEGFDHRAGHRDRRQRLVTRYRGPSRNERGATGLSGARSGSSSGSASIPRTTSGLEIPRTP